MRQPSRRNGPAAAAAPAAAFAATVVAFTTLFCPLAAWSQNQPTAPRSSSLQNQLPQPQVPVEPSRARIQRPVQRQEGREDQPVHLEQVKIAGVKALPFAEVMRLFQPLLHTDTTVGAIVKAADQVTALYRARGYALSYAYVPAQDLSSGSVQVVAVEGYVGSLTLKNAPPKLEAKIRAIAQHILDERPLRTATFERYVSLVAKLPDTGVDANVPVPATVDGATDLELTLRHRPYTVGASFDTNHPGFEGVLSASVNGVTTLGDQLTVSYMAPRGERDKGYYAVDYSLPLGSDGLALKLSGYHYEAKNRDFVFDDALLQRGYRDSRVTALLSYPLVLRADRALYLEGGGYASTTGDVFTQPPLPDRLDLRAHIRAAQINLNGSLQGRTSSTEGSVQFVQGLNQWGARQDADLVDLSFKRLRLFARRNDQWANGAFNTFVAATAQRSPSRLPLAEKITFGGNFFGAAYAPGEANGDSGYGVAAEVSKPFKVDTAYFKSIEPYLGADYAKVKTTNASVNRDALTSATVGVRLSLPNKYQISLSAAKPVGSLPIFETGRPVRWNLQGSVSF